MPQAGKLNTKLLIVYIPSPFPNIHSPLKDLEVLVTYANIEGNISQHSKT